MCGIAAVLAPLSAIDLESCAQRLTTALRHRGPDAEAYWTKTVTPGYELLLVHTRLAILDLSPGGNQPMHDPGTGNVVVFNGEIYNFADLRAELCCIDRAYRYRSTSDTEVLLRSYAHWGMEAFAKFDGMFSLVLLDARRRCLIVARDPLGIKPLYYVRIQDGGWAFASEVRALLSAGLCGRSLDLHAIGDYLRLGAVQEPATIFSEVRAFPSGHLVELPLDNLSILQPRPYWDPRAALTPLGEPKIHRAMLSDALAAQMVADVPVGLFLSAGIDSTVLAALAAERAGGRLQTFTIASGTGADNEAGLAAETASGLGLPHHIFSLGEHESIHWVSDGFDAMDQPSSDGINTYLVSRASREQGITVALSGTGADELHGGYNHFYLLTQMRRWLSHPLASNVVAILLRSLGRSTEAERLKLLLACSPNMPAMLEEKRRFLMPPWIAAHGPLGVNVTLPTKGGDGIDLLTEITLAELSGYLRNTLLRDSDWATMANAQELRVPYLGRRYVEYMLSIPWRAKGRSHGINKPLLTELVPKTSQEIIRRRKTGFELDYTALLLGPHRYSLIDAISALNCHDFRLDANTLLSRLEVSRSRKEARRLWALFALGRYLKRHVLRN